MPEVIGTLFRCEERPAVDVLDALPSYVAAVNDPPWSALAERVRPPVRVVPAVSMELHDLEDLAAVPDDGEVVVGVGGGTALDTAKFIAWRRGLPLIQVPTITSVDAGFTDAVGVRVDRRVRYIGKVVPELVVLDLPLIRGAPRRLNRAGIGDVLSCHTGLFDWQLASARGEGHPWRDDLAALGRQLLADLFSAIEDVALVSDDGVRFLASSYQRIGAACAEAGHSRFEEGSEHFWAYHYEHLTGEHHVHGELISLAVCALAFVQGNGAEWARSLVAKAGVRAHPADLGVSRDRFVEALVTLPKYARSEELDISVVDLQPPTAEMAESAWEFVCGLPREGSSAT
jgi:glycerol-1-phosphate dehydrogenase [NAD(P)+]